MVGGGRAAVPGRGEEGTDGVEEQKGRENFLVRGRRRDYVAVKRRMIAGVDIADAGAAGC